MKKKTLVTLVRTREWEGEQWSDTYLYLGEIDFEEAWRTAVDEYVATPEGKEEVRHNNGYFNWGDAVQSVPDHILGRHHIQTLTGNHVEFTDQMTVYVDQDELLVESPPIQP